MDLAPLLRATSAASEIRLAEVDAAKPDPTRRWIHAATEGDYSGHSAGTFSLDERAFKAFVVNFRADPRYQAGGTARVLPFDYEHASEMDPTSGSIPENGAPAPAWVAELDIRKGEDGKLQLWALAVLGDRIRGQIERGEYRFVSIAFVANMPHFESGESQGPTLTSIAFTNHPFLRNLAPLAASRRPLDRSPAPGVQHPNAGSPAGKERPMDFTKILPILARAKLAGTRTLATEEDVVAAVEEVSSGNASLVAVLEALGVKDASAALAAIPDLVAARAKLADALAQIDALTTQQAQQEEAMAQAEVEAALTAHFDDVKLRERVRPALKVLRATDKDGFRKAYPVPDQAHAHLLAQILAGKNGKQTKAPETLPLGERTEDPAVERVDLRAYPGRNATERIMSYILGKSPDAAKLSREALLAKAHELRRNPTLNFVV